MSSAGIISDRLVLAKKRHVCSTGETYHEIQPGDVYRRMYGAAEPGDPPWVLLMCGLCTDLTKHKDCSP